MRVLLVNNVNQNFKSLLTGHEIIHARDLSWGELQNGRLLTQAEAEGFDVLVTVDKQMRYQQNLSGRSICVVVLNCLLLKWSHITPLAPKVQRLLDSGDLVHGSFFVVEGDKT